MIRATAIIFHENKLLMIRHFRDENEYYVLPGGSVESGESPESAVLRELKEETSIQAELKYKIFSFSDTEGKEHQLFLCKYISGVPKMSKDSVEMTKTNHGNIYEPMWVEAGKLESLIIYPTQTKDLLLSCIRTTTRDFPKIIKDVGFDFSWDSQKVWALDISATEMNINELVWHFDIPFWELADTDDYNLTPNAVIKKETGTHLHREKIEKADTSFPIDIMENKGKWLILDGLHRLVKLYESGAKIVKVRIIPREKISEIL